MMVDLSFNFNGECWLWPGEKAAWHFISLPLKNSAEIKFFSEHLCTRKRGWGAVRVQATIGDTTWETSIFPHAKINTYILPIKAEVRKKEKFGAGDNVKVLLKIDV